MIVPTPYDEGSNEIARPGRLPASGPVTSRAPRRDPDEYVAMGLLVATILSSLFGFTAEAGPLVATLGQTAFLLFGAAFLLVAGRLWFWPENREDE